MQENLHNSYWKSASLYAPGVEFGVIIFLPVCDSVSGKKKL